MARVVQQLLKEKKKYLDSQPTEPYRHKLWLPDSGPLLVFGLMPLEYILVPYF